MASAVNKTLKWILAPNCSFPPLQLFQFQGQEPTCLSCWVADWLAAALLEGLIKGQKAL